jgi:hypothetical protein
LHHLLPPSELDKRSIEPFSSQDHRPVEHQANWLTRDAENTFLHARADLPSIEEILAIECLA